MPALLSGTTTADALLEADLWRRVAAGYRQKLIRNWSAWRRRARRLKEERDDALRERDEIAERCEEERKAHAKTRREAEARASEKAIEAANTRAALAEKSANYERKRTKEANDATARALRERDKATKDLVEHWEKTRRDVVQPAVGALLVLATRLGIESTNEAVRNAYENPRALADLLDRRILDLQKRAGDV